MLTQMTLLTDDLLGVGGRIKDRPDDFRVEEVPAYMPSGEGEHLFLWVEKRGMGAEYFTKAIARTLELPVTEVGTAGLKDRHAVTRQWVSVPARCQSAVGQLESDEIRVLTVSRHNNKLKPGHLRGNRFDILVRDADRERQGQAAQIIERLRQQGLPNYYGPQRFGHDGETAKLGFQLLSGTAPRLRRFMLKFALSAAQSALFNEMLARRIRDGYYRNVLAGDVLMKWPAGGMFVAEDVAVEQPRFDAREVVSGGPMFGSRMYAARGVAAEREAELLKELGIQPETFGRFGKLAIGTRRHNLVYVDDLTATWKDDGLRLQFTLPAGSYATVLLAELMKTNINDPDAANTDANENED